MREGSTSRERNVPVYICNRSDRALSALVLVHKESRDHAAEGGDSAHDHAGAGRVAVVGEAA